jgi:hypothetical protein
MVGLAVPEDFVLPEGYVRHHQATDDGQRIEAIRMFAPGRQFQTPPAGPSRCRRTAWCRRSWRRRVCRSAASRSPLPPNRPNPGADDRISLGPAG